MDKKTKKQLTLNNLIEENKKYSLTKKITVMDNYYVNVKPNISGTHLTGIFKEFGEWLKNEKVQEMLGSTDMLKYIMCFIVKYQTDLFEQINYQHNDIELYNIFQILLNSEAIDDIISNINERSLILVYEKYNDIIKVSEKIADIQGLIKKNENK